jgi:hypothetical protein
VGNPTPTARADGLFDVGVSVHDALTSEVAVAFTALPHGLFAAGVPVHEVITSEIAKEIGAEEETIQMNDD